jgi:hypothetical protein
MFENAFDNMTDIVFENDLIEKIQNVERERETRKRGRNAGDMFNLMFDKMSDIMFENNLF